MKTAVVILNWNTEGFLRKFLPGLLHSVRNVEGAEVIVADNDSTDGSMELMHEMFPDVRTIEFDNNCGFTGGYNRAFKEIEAEYFLLINSDIEVSEGWLEPLVGWMDSHPECGACAPKLHSWYERDRFEYAGAAGGYIDRFGYPFCRGRIMGTTEQDKGQYDSMAAEVFWASGACLMVRSALYDRLGGLDSRFFAHMEEIDLCWRIQLEGYSVCVVPQSVVYHVGGGTLPSTSPFKLFLNYRNNLLMLENNLARTYALKRFKAKLIKNEKNAGKAAEWGIRKADRIILMRKIMDGMSAAVYLATFSLSKMKAVYKAHKDYRRLSRKDDAAAIAGFILSHKDSTVKGIYDRWIVAGSMVNRNISCSDMSEKDFIKI